MDYEQIMTALRNADAAGDTEAATRLAAMARDARAATPSVENPSLMSRIGSSVYENVIGSGEVDTPGERLGELIRGGGAATARGIADVPAIPANLAQLGALGVEKAFGMDEPSMVSRALDKLPDTRDMLASIPVIGPESKYRADGLLGDYVATAGEFAGGAGLMAGPSAAIRYGVVPAVASESAGQITKGTAAEPYARTAAAIGTSLLAAPKPGAFVADNEASRMANRLQDSGVRNITQGQATGSPALMRAEGRLQATSQQIDDFTASTMRQIGSTEKVATPTALRAVEMRLVSQMDDAVRGVAVVPSASIATKAAKVATDYIDRVPAGSLTPRVRGISNELRALAVSGKSAPLARLKEWRTDIGRLTVSPDAATREAAHSMRTLIDEMTDGALQAAGRTDDIAALSAARESYRNYIGVRDAASRAGAEGGTLSPQALNQSVIRSQGREAYATGRTTPMSEFTRAGAATLRPAPTVNAGGVRTISEALPAGLAAAAGYGAYGAGLGPAGMAGAAMAGAALPVAAQGTMRSNAMQTMLRDPLRALTQPYPVAAGLLSQGQENQR